MIFILAESYLFAELYAKDNGLRRREWRCLYDKRQLVYASSVVVWLVGNWAAPPYGGCMQKYCEAMGYLMLEKAGSLGANKKKPKRKYRKKNNLK